MGVIAIGSALFTQKLPLCSLDYLSTSFEWIVLARPPHTIAPNNAPTPAVTPMAKTPQKVTRIAPTVTPAPPAPAANAPKSARNSSEVPGTRIIRLASGTKAVTKRGTIPASKTLLRVPCAAATSSTRSCCRNDTVVRAQQCRPQPADSIDAVSFFVAYRHTQSLLMGMPLEFWA